MPEMVCVLGFGVGLIVGVGLGVGVAVMTGVETYLREWEFTNLHLSQTDVCACARDPTNANLLPVLGGEQKAGRIRKPDLLCTGVLQLFLLFSHGVADGVCIGIGVDVSGCGGFPASAASMTLWSASTVLKEVKGILTPLRNKTGV